MLIEAFCRKRGLRGQTHRQSASARFDGHGMCFLETGAGMAGMGSGNFHAEPLPNMRMHHPNPSWRLAKRRCRPAHLPWCRRLGRGAVPLLRLSAHTVDAA
jgi:hypothetical protein